MHQPEYRCSVKVGIVYGIDCRVAKHIVARWDCRHGDVIRSKRYQGDNHPAIVLPVMIICSSVYYCFWRISATGVWRDGIHSVLDEVVVLVPCLYLYSAIKDDGIRYWQRVG